MASVCVNNVAVSQEFPTYRCFNPRANSFSREDAGEFEFMLEDQVGIMLPADELFSDGKLITKQSKETEEKCKRETEIDEISTVDHNNNNLFSHKAPRSSSRWKEFLGLKRFSQNTKSVPTTTTTNPRPSIKQFLNRSSKSSSDSSLINIPLLKDSDTFESLSITEDLPRFSLDSNHNQNVTANPFAPARSLNPNPPRMRLVKQSNGRVGRSQVRCHGGEIRGVSVDSPRLNSSGKIVFQSLERSSSSPSSFNGGTSGYRHRAIERSYSSNLRVTPVLNVPVCSIRIGQFFSPSVSSQQNRTGNGGNKQGGIIRGRNSTDRI